MTNAASPSPGWIPFNRPFTAGSEFEYIRQAINQMHTAGDGPFSRRCQEVLERETGSLKALLTTSCTHALEMAALLLDFEPGDEVILPSFTFVSTANAFALRGARPIFVDIRSDTLNLDERLVEEARRVAAAMGKSVNQLVREYLEQITSKATVEEDIAELRRLSRESRGDSRGWSFDRDEIHGRP